MQLSPSRSLWQHCTMGAAGFGGSFAYYAVLPLFFFQDTALPYMIVHAAGSLTVEQVCPGGLLELRKQSRGAYWKA